MNNNFQKGFSLVELTVVVAIFIILMFVANNFVIRGFRSINFISDQEEAVQQARKALENISVDIREAKRSERSDYPLSVAEEQNFVWYGDVDNDDIVEQIHYYLSSSTNQLIRVVTEPGNSNDYTGISATTTISEYVNNEIEPLFYYLDSDNSTTSLIGDVRMVNIVLKINATPEIAPADYYIETDVQLRNLKDNL